MVDIGNGIVIGILSAVFGAGASWGVIRYRVNEISRASVIIEKDKERLLIIDSELQRLRVLLVGVENQGGILSEINSLRKWRHQISNEIQILQNRIYLLTGKERK